VRRRIEMAYNDIDDEGNSEQYHTAKKCIEPGCNNPAGTAWSPFWCVKHNMERMDKINRQMEEIQKVINTNRRKA
jgi:hypothetical protein